MCHCINYNTILTPHTPSTWCALFCALQIKSEPAQPGLQFGEPKPAPCANSPMQHAIVPTTTPTPLHILPLHNLVYISDGQAILNAYARYPPVRAKTLTLTRSLHPGLPPPQPAYQHQHTYSLYILRNAFSVARRYQARTRSIRVLGPKPPPSPDLCIPASHHLNPHIDINKHTSSTPSATHFQWPGNTEHIHSVSAC